MAVRSFIAFNTSDSIRERMEALQTKLRGASADIRWESRENLHATIKFLGNVDEQQLPSVISVAGDTVRGFKSFDVTCKGLGCFPNALRPRVIWIGCEDRGGMLPSLKQALDNSLIQFGIEREEREFHPHITLGRVKTEKRIDQLTHMLESLTFDEESFRCREILLMKSTLNSRGAEYTSLSTFLLGED